MSTPSAKLSCKCGNVVLSILSPPEKRIECCCVDCHYASAWVAKRGCHKTPPRETELMYFPNTFSVDKGLENLHCYLINEGYNTRRVVASCCWTPMMGDHLIYRGEKFVCYPQAANLTMLGENKIGPVELRMFLTDLTDEEFAVLPPMEVDPRTYLAKHSGRYSSNTGTKEAFKKQEDVDNKNDEEKKVDSNQENPQEDNPQDDDASVASSKQENDIKSVNTMVNFFAGDSKVSDDDDLDEEEQLELPEHKYITIQSLMDDEIGGKPEIMNRDYVGPKTFWNKSYPDGPYH